jgi:hypothetical protein
MKNVRTIWLVAVVLFLAACPALGVVEFKDGWTHNIDYAIYDDVWVDYQAPSKYTTVNWLAGAWTQFLIGYGHSKINFRGGSVHWLSSRDSSQANISGGQIQELDCFDSSQVRISSGFMDGLLSYGSSRVNIYGSGIDNIHSYGSSEVNIHGGWIDNIHGCDSSRINIYGGGYIYYGLEGYDSSQISITGGSIHGDLKLWGGKIQISGSDFAVDGQSVGYGELTSILGHWPEDEPLRHLTGKLLSSELINNDFYIGYNARIILIPEPATMALLGIGLLFLRKRQERRWMKDERD